LDLLVTPVDVPFTSDLIWDTVEEWEEVKDKLHTVEEGTDEWRELRKQYKTVKVEWEEMMKVLKDWTLIMQQKVPRAWRELYNLDKGQVLDDIDALYEATLRVEFASKIGIPPGQDVEYEDAWDRYVAGIVTLLDGAWSVERCGDKPVAGMGRLDMKKIREGIETKVKLFMLRWPVLEDGDAPCRL
ncbi:hypothetical protein EWM64_g7291, partial [Hericium alpestre]